MTNKKETKPREHGRTYCSHGEKHYAISFSLGKDIDSLNQSDISIEGICVPGDVKDSTIYRRGQL